jgi:hypothetical protein
VATAVVALAFQPARRRASQLADRLVYGEQAAPYEALAYFNDELRRISSLGDLLPRMAEAAGRTLGAHRVRVWADRPEREPMVAAWSSSVVPEGPGEIRVPVSDRSEPLGGLAVTMPRGRPLRRAEQRLLDDFAVQLGAAFRAARLEGELAARVSLLARRSDELAESRSRLVSAREQARARFEAAIADQVLPHLRPVPERLRGLRAWSESTQRWPAREVDALIAGTNEGLEALRTLTRGVFPAQLTRRGLASALSTHLEETGVAYTLSAEGAATGRFRQEVESAAYFCAVEVVRQLQGPLRAELNADTTGLTLTLTGYSEAPLEGTTRHLVDRVETLGGTVSFAREGREATWTLRLLLDHPAEQLPELVETVGAEV